VEAKYAPEGKDKVTVSTYFKRCEEPMLQSGLTLSHSNNLAQSNLDSLSNGIKEHFYRNDYRMAYYNFNQKEDARPVVIQEFEGNVFKITTQDLGLNFRFFTTSDFEEFPVDIYISGISDLSISSVQPEPTRRLKLALYYHFNSNKDETLNSGIYFDASDRFKTYNLGFRLFFVGTLIGVLISIAVTVLLDVITHIEKSGSTNN